MATRTRRVKKEAMMRRAKNTGIFVVVVVVIVVMMLLVKAERDSRGFAVMKREEEEEEKKRGNGGFKWWSGVEDWQKRRKERWKTKEDHGAVAWVRSFYLGNDLTRIEALPSGLLPTPALNLRSSSPE